VLSLGKARRLGDKAGRLGGGGLVTKVREHDGERDIYVRYHSRRDAAALHQVTDLVISLGNKLDNSFWSSVISVPRMGYIAKTTSITRLNSISTCSSRSTSLRRVARSQASHSAVLVSPPVAWALA